MIHLLTDTTEEQRKAARTAATQRYEHNRYTPNRPGWKGGKCPVNEYRAIIAEIGAANFLGIDWHELVLFSTNPADYMTSDLGVWEVKAGRTFGKKDKDKGAKFILWTDPRTKDSTFKCGYDTCKAGIHNRLSGEVEICGWTDLVNDDFIDKGNYYMPKTLHSAFTLATGEAA